MVRSAQHNDADAVFAFELVKNLTRPATDASLVILQRLVADLYRAVVLFLRQSEDRLPGLQHLMGEEFAVGKVQHRVHVLDIVLCENIILFRERGLHRLRGRGHGWTSVRSDNLHEWRSQHIVHGEENDVQGLLAMLLLDQVVDVRDADLRGETGIDGAAAGAGSIQIGTSVVRINDVLRLQTKAFEISVEQRGVGVDVQDTGNTNAKFLATLHERDALFRRLVPEFRRRNRIGYALRIHRTKDLAGSEVHEVGIFPLDLVETGLDVLHIVDIFDLTLFAGRDDQALLAMHQRNLGDFLYGDKAHVVRWCRSYIDKCAQAIVLAEMTARLLVSGRAIVDFSHSIQSDKCGLLAIAPKSQRLCRRANRARFSAELVNNDLGFLAGSAETILNEIHFRFHHGHVVLRSALQHKARAQRSEIGNAGYVQEHVLGKHRCQTCKNFFSPPALALEIHDVGLHEHRAAVAEDGHGLGCKSQIGILFNA